MFLKEIYGLLKFNMLLYWKVLTQKNSLNRNE